MSYDVYWVKNVQKKIADFEHPTREGFICVYFLPHRVAPYITKDSIKIHDSLMIIYD